MIRRRDRDALVEVLRAEVRAELPRAHAADPAGPGAWLEGAVHRRVIVHTRDDKSYRGLLRVAAADGVVLCAAELLGKESTPLAGDVFIPRGNVHSVQTDRL